MSGDAPYAVYLEHLKRGELAYQFSASAGRAVFYPRVMSPYDIDEALEWRVSRGLGTVYSTTAISSRDGSDYNVALVDCDEGFRLMSRIDGCAPREVRIGMRVRFEAHPAADAESDPYPVFVPMEAAP
jgi:uncharacterized OB-fold protein